jgi:hypothetical protein
MPAPKNLERAKEVMAKHGFDPNDPNRWVSQAEAAWRSSVSADALDKQSKLTGRPRCKQITARRKAYWLPDIIEM